MKTISVICAIVTLLLILSTLICGLWLKSKGADVEGIAFHIKIGIAASTSAVLTSILLIVAAGRM